jgi:acyl transferase domain-containing protein
MGECDSIKTSNASGVAPIAIIGASFRLPQEAVSEDSFWEVLVNGKNLMTEWPDDRAAVNSFIKGEVDRPNMVCLTTSYQAALVADVQQLSGRGAHFVRDDPAAFDAPFFSVPSKEAVAMDPQQRWALEAAYHALENGKIVDMLICQLGNY